jgi:hypothetical protein
MAIDDPVDILIRRAQEESEAEAYLPVLVTRLGMSAVAAATLSQWPFVSNIITTLLRTNIGRMEDRFFKVAEELNAQVQRIEDKIPDKGYYEFDEFRTLFTLVLERLHSTHQEEKLKMFGDALANTGSRDFHEDDREQYIRTLRDLSLDDLRLLQRAATVAKLPIHFQNLKVKDSEKPSIARLVGLGLINESHRLKDFHLSIPAVPSSSQSAELSARGLADAFSEYFQKAPMTIHQISNFGERFLSFISEQSGEPEKSVGVLPGP